MRGRSDPASWGIQLRYQDATERLRDAPARTVAAVLAAMGAEGVEPTGVGAPLVVRAGDTRRLEQPATLVLEDGSDAGEVDRLPADLGLGYHRLSDAAGDRPLIVSPGRCHLPAQLRTWGFSVQLYALRSRSSWGMGDLADLRALMRWSKDELGAGMVLVNPLHAAVPVLPQQASPYYPSSRRFHNPIYLRVEEVEGAASLGAELEEIARAGRALTHGPRIDRDAVWRLKSAALQRIFESGGAGTVTVEPDGALRDFALHCALAETHGASWRTWPASLRRPDDPAVALFASRNAHRVRFHAWLQQQMEDQLGGASAEGGITLMQDLAVGVDPDGADAWLLQDVLAPDVSVGAPPDEFNGAGQDWGLPPFDPWRLRSAAYRPFAEMVRASLRHAGALRIDHVMGLFRLFWIPVGADPSDGVYVRYPAPDLLDVLALESVRAGAYVCGEDLGTVEKGMRAALAEREVLSYRLLWFEDSPPATWPRRAMAAVTTHDLPTVVGLLRGADATALRAAGVDPNETSWRRIAARVSDLAGIDATTGDEDAVTRVHGVLGRAPCMVLTATLDDAVASARRPNLPGTTLPTNWTAPLPATLEEVMAGTTARSVARALGRSARR